MSSLTITASVSSGHALTTDTCPTPQYSAISGHSSVRGTPQAIREWLMSSAPDSPASRLAPQESDSELTTSAICGPQQSSASAWYDRDTACWRTYQDSFLAATLEPYSETWPRAGMTLDGVFYPQPKWERPIDETGCSFWPTPTKRDYRSPHADNSEAFEGRKNNPRGVPLVEQVQREAGGVGGQLNPTWVEWLMGWPLAWTDLKPLAMDKFLLWWRSHGDCSGVDDE